MDNKFTLRLVCGIVLLAIACATVGIIATNHKKNNPQQPVVVSGNDVCNYCRNQLVDQMAITAIEAKKIEINNNGSQYLFVLKSVKKVPVPKPTLKVENVKM